MVPALLSERKVNTTFAILAVVFSVISGVIAVVGAGSFFMGAVEGLFGYGHPYGRIVGGMVIVVFSGLLGILSAIFTLIVLNQWSSTLNENIQNSKILLDYAKQKVETEKQMNLVALQSHLSVLSLNVWAYWAYLIVYVISFFIPMLSFVLWILSVIFLSIYLQSVFTVAKKLEEIKNIMYPVFGISSPMMSYIKQRSIGVFILLVIVTLGIYWWYLLIKLSDEINQYIDADQKLRQAISL